MRTPKTPNATDVYVGARLRMRRLMLGMSQEALAGQLGITFQQVQKYEKGTNRISASRIDQLGRILSVPPSFFFEDAPAPRGLGKSKVPAPSFDYVTNFLATTDGLALVEAFMKIKSAQTRRKIVGLVDEISQFDGAAAE